MEPSLVTLRLVHDGSCVSALEHMVEGWDLPPEAEATLALARRCAYMVDEAPMTTYATTARAYHQVLRDLAQYKPQPEVTDEDPFDALSRRLATLGDAAD